MSVFLLPSSVISGQTSRFLSLFGGVFFLFFFLFWVDLGTISQCGVIMRWREGEKTCDSCRFHHRQGGIGKKNNNKKSKMRNESEIEIRFPENSNA